MQRDELIARLARIIDIQESVADDHGLGRRRRATLTAPVFDLLCEIEEEGEDDGTAGVAAAPPPPPPSFTPALLQVPPYFPDHYRLGGGTFTATDGASVLQQPEPVATVTIQTGTSGAALPRNPPPAWVRPGAAFAVDLAATAPGATPSILAGASLVRPRETPGMAELAPTPAEAGEIAAILDDPAVPTRAGEPLPEPTPEERKALARPFLDDPRQRFVD